MHTTATLFVWHDTGLNLGLPRNDSGITSRRVPLTDAGSGLGRKFTDTASCAEGSDGPVGSRRIASPGRSLTASLFPRGGRFFITATTRPASIRPICMSEDTRRTCETGPSVTGARSSGVRPTRTRRSPMQTLPRSVRRSRLDGLRRRSVGCSASLNPRCLGSSVELAGSSLDWDE